MAKPAKPAHSKPASSPPKSGARAVLPIKWYNVLLLIVVMALLCVMAFFLLG